MSFFCIHKHFPGLSQEETELIEQRHKNGMVVEIIIENVAYSGKNNIHLSDNEEARQTKNSHLLSSDSNSRSSLVLS